MIASTLPLILIVHLHAAPSLVATADGLQHGVVSLARLAGGAVADRVRSYRSAAAAGYLLSALCRLGFLASTLPAQFLFFLSADRVGKGFRTGPRDAFLARSARVGEEARAFGLHRSLDTAGAMLGPLIGYWVLALVPGDYSVVLLFSLAFAAVGVFVFLTCTRDSSREVAGGQVGIGEFTALLLRPGTRKLAFVALLLGLFTLGDHVIYLALQRRHGFALSEIPLFYVATPAACMCLSYPLGLLADRYQRWSVLIAGYASIIAAYVVIALPLPSWLAIALVVLLLGLHYAATEGVFMAIASRDLPEATRASGFSLISTANGLARLFGGLLFGVLWAATSDVAALLSFAAAAAVSSSVCARMLSRRAVQVEGRPQ